MVEDWWLKLEARILFYWSERVNNINMWRRNPCWKNKRQRELKESAESKSKSNIKCNGLDRKLQTRNGCKCNALVDSRQTCHVIKYFSSFIFYFYIIYLFKSICFRLLSFKIFATSFSFLLKKYYCILLIIKVAIQFGVERNIWKQYSTMTTIAKERTTVFACILLFLQKRPC